MAIETLKKIGDGADIIGEKFLELIPTQSQTTAKIVSVLVYAFIIYLAVHFAGSLKKPVTYIIIILMALLIISIAATFIQ